MRAASDLTGAALIRETAMRLTADRGWETVSIRDIAAAANVSSSLVVHHYGTKNRLRQAVDERAVGAFTALIEQFPDLDEGDSAGMSMVAAFHEQVGDDSPVLAYVRRLLIDGGEAGTALFDALFAATERMLDTLAARGLLTPTDDAPARAAFLLVNDLAMVLMRTHVTRVLGVDPFSRAGLARLGRTVLDVYRSGVLDAPGDDHDRKDEGGMP